MSTPSLSASHEQGEPAVATGNTKPPELLPKIAIRQFEPHDLDAVLTLFKDGMMMYTQPEHPHYQVWVNYVSNSLATDLADILDFYLRPEGSTFFVATAVDAASGNSMVVGTIAVERKSDELAELRRVSVKAEYRRFGLGRLLMAHATQWAKDKHKYTRLTLSTAATQYLAIKFYESLGYTFTKTSVLCENPYFELTHFEKAI